MKICANSLSMGILAGAAMGAAMMWPAMPGAAEAEPAETAPTQIAEVPDADEIQEAEAIGVPERARLPEDLYAAWSQAWKMVERVRAPDEGMGYSGLFEAANEAIAAVQTSPEERDDALLAAARAMIDAGRTASAREASLARYGSDAFNALAEALKAGDEIVDWAEKR